MRQLLLAMTVWAAVIFSTRAAEVPALKTNSVAVGKEGVLKITAPKDWSFVQTNTPGAPTYAGLISPNKSIGIELWIYWDGFGKAGKPTQADFELMVSNACAGSYQPASVERKTVLETLKGPSVTGTFARFTEADWKPMVKGDYPNVANGMFRSGNLWGKFNLVTYDKDGPQFKQGLKVLESLRREP